MKLRLLIILAVISSAAAVLMAFGGYPNGSPAGYTGSPGDGHNCTSCHGGSASAVTGMISTNIPPTGYIADSIYQITVTITGSGAKGFEVSPQNVGGTQLGTLIAGTNNHLVSGTKYVTQSAKISTTPATWVFAWKAPAAGTGNVTFYAAYCIGKPVTKLENITVTENVTAPLTVDVTANPMTINLGDSTHLYATASGGSGTYTYTWSSVPAGFTSTIQNPWVKPLVTTFFACEVSDLTNVVSGSVTITVQNPQGVSSADGTGMTLSPNPSTGIVNVGIAGKGSQLASISLCNATGKAVYQSELILNEGKTTHSFDFSDYAKGLYFLSVTIDGTRKVQSLLLF